MSRFTCKGLSWLQLSDLHVFKEADTNLMKDSFKKLAKVIHPQFVVVTGDYRHLAYKQDSTYPDASDYLSSIISYFGIPKEYVYLVPGNHDVTDSDARHSAISEIVENTEAKYEYYKKFNLGHGSEFTLEKGFDEYNAFVSSFYAGSNVRGARVSNPSGVFVSNYENRINILHINTALISDKERNKDGTRVHPDIVDLNQIAEISSDLDSSIPSIVIGHHGLDDLYPGHKERLERILRDHHSAYLHGDIHRFRNNPIRLENPNEVAPSIACGKSCPQEGDDYSDVGVVYYSCKDECNVEVIVYGCDVNGFYEITKRPFVYEVNKRYTFPLRFSDNGDTESGDNSITNKQNVLSNGDEDKINMPKMVDMDEKAKFIEMRETNNCEEKDPVCICGTTNNMKRIMGYCLNFGMNSCRVFEIHDKNEGGLKEVDPVIYRILPPKIKDENKPIRDKTLNAFLDEIIQITKNKLQITNEKGKFIKVYADAEFSDLFHENETKDAFIEKYYKSTGLLFQILTHKQTEDNLKALFNDVDLNTAIIDICSSCVYVVIKYKTQYKEFLINVSTESIRTLFRGKEWDVSSKSQLQEFIRGKIGSTFGKSRASKAIIIKDEELFMEKMGYPLINCGSYMQISFSEYAKHNAEKIYINNFEESVDKAFADFDKRKRNKFYGFKEGHIILETVFELLGVGTIIPSNVPNILRSPFAHIFNVVLSGSTKPSHIEYMKQAYAFMEKQQIHVLHPHKGDIGSKTHDSYSKHEQAIKKCDLLFVCNGDGYIGEQTKCDIYAATLLSKPIAYWREPIRIKAQVEDYDYSAYIPHDNYKQILEDSGFSGAVLRRGCIIGSFRKFYADDITRLINEFANNGIDILSPKNSKIIDPKAQFVILETDDEDLQDYEIQAKVFEKVRDSDFVYVWDPDGYIGKTTCYEIGRIIERGTPLYYYQRPKDIPLEITDDHIVDVDRLIEMIKDNSFLA